MNPFHVWAADQNEPELWEGNKLVRGGKHYGFLEIDVLPRGKNEFRVVHRSWHTFPVNAGDEAFSVTGFELRPYSNVVVLQGPADNLQSISPACIYDLNADGTVDGADLAVVLGAWGEASKELDLDGNRTVDARDLALVLGAWGADCN